MVNKLALYTKKYNEVMQWLATDVVERAKQIARREGHRINGKMTLRIKTDGLSSEEVDMLIEELDDSDFSDIVDEVPDWCDDDVLVEECDRIKDYKVWKYVGFAYESYSWDRHIWIKKIKDGLEIKVGFFYWYEAIHFPSGEVWAIRKEEFEDVKRNILPSSFEADSDRIYDI